MKTGYIFLKLLTHTLQGIKLCAAESLTKQGQHKFITHTHTILNNTQRISN